jgi:hypothetical protein
MATAYNPAFACLLRSDDLLKVQTYDIKVKLFNLNVRSGKTIQFSGESPSHLFAISAYILVQGVKPSPLHKLPDHQADLYPVRAMADWLKYLHE